MSAHKAQSINKGAFLQEDGTSRNVVRAVTLAWVPLGWVGVRPLRR